MTPYIKVYQLEELGLDEMRTATEFFRATTNLAYTCPGAGWKKGLQVFGEVGYPSVDHVSGRTQ